MKKTTPKNERYVILYNIRSAHNVGSVFRTCDGAGVSKIYLVGVTPTPVDRFGRARPDIAKVALGGEITVPWEYVEEIDLLLDELQEEGVMCVSVEQTPEARDYRTHTLKGATAYIFGNEREGVPKEIVARSDDALEIPLAGSKESLNVSVTVGIILFTTQGVHEA